MPGSWLIDRPIILIMIDSGETTSLHRPARRRGPLVAVAVITSMLIFCCAPPALVAGAWFVRGTLEASKGEPYPETAIQSFMWDVFDTWGSRDDSVNVICGKRSDEVNRQIDAYRAQLDAYAKKWDLSWRFNLGPTKSTETDEDSSTIVENIQLELHGRDINGREFTQDIMDPWTFKLIKQSWVPSLSPGWKVCEFAPAPAPAD